MDAAKQMLRDHPDILLHEVAACVGYDDQSYFSKIFRNFALRLLAVVLGAVIYYLVIQVVLQLGLDTNDLKLLTALVVALFLTVPHLKEKITAKSRIKKEATQNAGN